MLAPWQPRRILWNGYGAYPGAPAAPTDTKTHKSAIDGTDQVTGASFAVPGRQEPLDAQDPGLRQFLGGLRRQRSPGSNPFQVLDGEPAEKDFMDGVDTTWGRLPGGAEIGTLAGSVIDHFDPANPAASVPALLDIKARLAALAADPVVDEKRRQLDRILQSCLGLSVETAVPATRLSPARNCIFAARPR